MKRPSWKSLVSMLAGVLTFSTVVLGQGVSPEPEPLTVATWGGAYEESQRRAYFDPFTEATGIPIRTVHYDGGIKVLEQHLASGDVEWDVIDMIQSDASAACDGGDHPVIHHF